MAVHDCAARACCIDIVRTGAKYGIQLRMERDLLKKAAAFFARESK